MLKSHASKINVVSRGKGWLKLKKDYIEGMSDSLDCVVLGAWRGSGRKSRWYSPFLVGVKNAEGEYGSICRVMSGFTDEVYQKLYDKFSKLIVAAKPYGVSTEENAIWFDLEHSEVWEIKGADLTLSPKHRACNSFMSEGTHVGIGLRFPRFIRAREDKALGDASTAEMVMKMYNAQFE